MRPRMLVLACIMIGVPVQAHAYIDPGAGSLMFQAVAALAIGIAAG